MPPKKGFKITNQKLSGNPAANAEEESLAAAREAIRQCEAEPFLAADPEPWQGESEAVETQVFVGRLRRWHAEEEWGLIFSALHHCDIFFGAEDTEEGEASSAGETKDLTEGALVLFGLKHGGEGLPVSAVDVRVAHEVDMELEQQMGKLLPVCPRYAGRCLEESGTCPAGHWLEREAGAGPEGLKCALCGRAEQPHGGAGALVCRLCRFLRCARCHEAEANPDADHHSGDQPGNSSRHVMESLRTEKQTINESRQRASRAPRVAEAHAIEALEAHDVEARERLDGRNRSAKPRHGTLAEVQGTPAAEVHHAMEPWRQESQAPRHPALADHREQGQNLQRPRGILRHDMNSAAAVRDQNPPRLLLDVPRISHKNFTRIAVTALLNSDVSRLRRGHTIASDGSSVGRSVGREFGRFVREAGEALNDDGELEPQATQGDWWGLIFRGEQ